MQGNKQTDANGPFPQQDEIRKRGMDIKADVHFKAEMNFHQFLFDSASAILGRIRGNQSWRRRLRILVYETGFRSSGRKVCKSGFPDLDVRYSL